MSAVRKAKPKEGMVLALSVTEKQFAAMEFVVGEYNSDVVDTDERLVIL
jgi:CRISPR-associated protein Cas2